MITPNDIIYYLQRNLPAASRRFGKRFPSVNAYFYGNTAYATAPNHGLNVGDYIVVSNATEALRTGISKVDVGDSLKLNPTGAVRFTGGESTNASASITFGGTHRPFPGIHVILTTVHFTISDGADTKNTRINIFTADDFPAMASRAATAINSVDDIPVTATTSGAVLILTANTGGLTGNNYTVSTRFDPPRTDLSVSATSFSGGDNTTRATARVKLTGAASPGDFRIVVTVGRTNHTFRLATKAGNTLATIVSRMAVLINKKRSLPVTATPNNNILTLTVDSAGVAGNNYRLTATHTPIVTEAIITTAADHDVTEPRKSRDPKTVKIGGIGYPWDGDHEIIAAPNRREIIIDAPDGVMAAPDLDATPGYVVDRDGSEIIGQHIITYAAKNEFRFDIPGIPPFSGANWPVNIDVYSGLRIFGAADFERAAEMHNKMSEGEYSLYVIMSGVNIAKDRHTLSDATASLTAQSSHKLTATTDFSTTVFFPTRDDAGGNDARQAAYGEIYEALLRTLYGATIDGRASGSYAIAPLGHGPGEYNTSYLVEVYDWQAVDILTADQGVRHDERSVAFRDIDLDQYPGKDKTKKYELSINLDDQPFRSERIRT